MITVRRLTTVTDAQIHELALVLIDCVEGGASVSFMLPLSLEKATTFWRQVARDVAANARALLIAEDSTGIVGTVQLVFAQPENQPHRADISKLLVHRRARRLGIGEALMREADHVARFIGAVVGGQLREEHQGAIAREEHAAGYQKAGHSCAHARAFRCDSPGSLRRAAARCPASRAVDGAVEQIAMGLATLWR